MVALKYVSKIGFNKSLSPIDTEPVVTSTSTFSKAFSILFIIFVALQNDYISNKMILSIYNYYINK